MLAVQFTPENGEMACVMDKASRSGLMVHAMKVAGSMIRQTATASSTMQTAMSTKVTGKTIKQMDVASIHMPTELNTTENGVTTNSTVTE